MLRATADFSRVTRCPDKPGPDSWSSGVIIFLSVSFAGRTTPCARAPRRRAIYHFIFIKQMPSDLSRRTIPADGPAHVFTKHLANRNGIPSMPKQLRKHSNTLTCQINQNNDYTRMFPDLQMFDSNVFDSHVKKFKRIKPHATRMGYGLESIKRRRPSNKLFESINTKQTLVR